MQQSQDVLIVDFETNKAVLQIDLNPKLTLLQARSEIQEQGGFQNFNFVNKDGVKKAEKTKTIEASLTDGNLLLIRFEKPQSESKSESKVEKANDKSQYKCEKGHNLFFLNSQTGYAIYGSNYFQEMTISMCYQCKQKTYCRTICPQCSVKGNLKTYCNRCKMTPCTKHSCPFSHKLNKNMNISPIMLCDFCGNNVVKQGSIGYRDNNCDFDLCEPCFLKLPETHELVPLKTPKSSIQHLHQ